MAGDVCGIIRIHAFLEHWGIINFNVDPYLKSRKVSMAKIENNTAGNVEDINKNKYPIKDDSIEIKSINMRSCFVLEMEFTVSL